MRLFTCINLSKKEKSKIKRYADLLKIANVGGRFVDYDNYHITLAFIGETDDADTAASVLRGINVFPFTLTVNAVGSFKDVLWVGPTDSEEITRLMRLTANRLRCSGYDIEKQKPEPHITISRATKIPRGMLIPLIEPVEVSVNRISLMRSDFFGSSVRYTEIFGKDLNNGQDSPINQEDI